MSDDKAYRYPNNLTDEQARRFTVFELRTRKGWRQLDLAYHAHVSLASISLIEQGKQRPRVDVAIRIARALEWPVEGIVWGMGSETSGDTE